MKTLRFAGWLGSLLLTIGACAAVANAETEDHASLWTTFTDTFDGYVENSTAVRLNELDHLTKIENSLDLKFEHAFGDAVNLKLDMLSVYDAVYDVDDDLDVTDEDEYHAYVDPREATLNFTVNKFELRLGRQQVLWEKTDSLRVLDAVNPLDLREYLFDDFDSLRIPLWMANVEYYFNTDFSLQALVIPDLTFTELPHAGSEFELASTPPPTGIRPIVNAADEPDSNVENTEYGLRLQGLLKGWDVTLNYLYTWNDTPFKQKTLDLTAGTITVTPAYARQHLIGGSLVNVLGGTVCRLEIAAKTDEFYSVTDPRVTDMVVDKTALHYALAFERDLLGVSWILQGYQRYVLDYDERISPEDELTTTLTLRASKALNQEETLEFEVKGAYRANDDDYYLNPKLQYALTDAWKGTLGAYLIGGGDAYSFYGQYDANDSLYAELRYSF